ncbi:hypothetical protein HMN09_01148300 [Mycena chlorophos]|uniref:Uncharacterized protein n=1 Tax=Mycena chlorophos TaxID=658473 RepID=A0A8H6S7A4_MYCCL|nr:hypothetical protein HMN09_01148300 [Mycena chlorophos]
MDPCHLEAYIYGFWFLVLFQYVPATSGGSFIRIIQPQWPIWSSARDTRSRAIVNAARLSLGSEPDGLARGVYVDLAVVIIRTMPRKKLPRRSRGLYSPLQLAGKSLQWFFENFLVDHPALEPSFIRVVALMAPVLVELKLGAPRHAPDLPTYYNELSGLIQDAERQAEKQALALYASWRFRFQQYGFSIAGAGEDFSVCRTTRSWANKDLPQRLNGLAGDFEKDDDDDDEEQPNPPPNPNSSSAAQSKQEKARNTLIDSYTLVAPSYIDARREEIDQLCDDAEDEDDEESEDRDDVHASGVPRSDFTRIDEARRAAEDALRMRARAQRLHQDFDAKVEVLKNEIRAGRSGPRVQRSMAEAEQQLANHLANYREAVASCRTAMTDLVSILKPTQNDTLRPFSEADINLYHRFTFAASDSRSFYETRTPEDFFSGQENTVWSGVLHLGTQLAEDYLRYIEGQVRQWELEEIQRRSHVYFPSYDTQ